MGLLEKINWRNPVNVFSLFLALGGLFFLCLHLYQVYQPDPEPAPTVTLTVEQIHAIQEPGRLADSVRDAKQQERDQVLLQAANRSIRASDSLNAFFDKQQSVRDEKYNHALSASDPELMRQWSDRYDR